MSSTPSDATLNVEFHDVYMVGSVSELAEDFNPKFDDGLGELHVESLEYIDRSERYRDVEQENRGLFRVFVVFGARWATKEAPGDVGDEIDDAAEEEDRILATIEGSFVVEYLISDDIDQEQLDSYALQHSITHAFPSWRDYLLGQCSKLHLNAAKQPRRISAPFGLIKA
nr:hypothetical protein [uncultured Pseudomonas sp.]